MSMLKAIRDVTVWLKKKQMFKEIVWALDKKAQAYVFIHRRTSNERRDAMQNRQVLCVTCLNAFGLIS